MNLVSYQNYLDLCEEQGRTALDEDQQWRKHFHVVLEEIGANRDTWMP